MAQVSDHLELARSCFFTLSQLHLHMQSYPVAESCTCVQCWRCSAGKPTLRRGSTFTFRSPHTEEREGVSRGQDARPAGAHSLRRTISVPVTSTSRDTAPLAFHAKAHGASRAAVAGNASCYFSVSGVPNFEPRWFPGLKVQDALTCAGTGIKTGLAH